MEINTIIIIGLKFILLGGGGYLFGRYWKGPIWIAIIVIILLVVGGAIRI